MKKITACVSVILFFIFSDTTIAQTYYSPLTNTFENTIPEENKIMDLPSSTGTDLKIGGGITCNPNTFWANNGSNSLVEFSLIGTTITNTGISYPIPYLSLIFANNTNGPTGFSPTFYSPDGNFSSDLRYFDGASWPIAASALTFKFFNGGGSGNHIYCEGNPDTVLGPSTQLYYYDQSSINPVYTTPAGRFIFVDETVDLNGNGYFFTGPNVNTADSLMVISPTGVIVKTFAVSFNPYNGYGAFMMGNTIYVGLGSNNTINPLTLLPITISGNTATVGTPIPFPVSTGYIDLESCNQGLPLYIPTVSDDANAIYITNPVKDICTVTSGKEKIKAIVIYDMSGKKLKAVEINNSSTQLNISDFSDGIYVLSIQFKDAFVQRKLVVQNN